MSKTTENLKAAFAGESQARNKYTFFAKVARAEGYHYIAKIFEETAVNEMQHAKDHLKLLNGIGDTAANLKEAFDGEDYEVKSMYPGFAKDAEEEGETAAAIAFKQVAKIEAHHRARYSKLLEMVEAGTVFKREQPIKWKCSVCGYIYEGNEPPPKCPSCKHAKEYYEPASLDFQGYHTAVYIGAVCYIVYDADKEGVKRDDSLDDWVYPVCNSPKSMFKLVEDSGPVAEADPTASASDNAEATITDEH